MSAPRCWLCARTPDSHPGLDFHRDLDTGFVECSQCHLELAQPVTRRGLEAQGLTNRQVERGLRLSWTRI